MGKFATNVMPVVGAAMEGLGGIASLFTQGIQHKHEKSLNERSIEAQKEQAEYAYSKELEQWERANAYNAPTQQMERLRTAGLNPAMIYGSGGAKTQAATLPKYQSVKPEYNYAAPVNPMQILSAYNEFRRSNAEVDLIQENAKKARIETQYANTYYRGRGMISINRGAREYYKRLVEGFYDTYNTLEGREGRKVNQLGYYSQFQKQIQKLDAEISNTQKRTELTDKQIEYYLWSNFGNMAIGAAKQLFNPLKKIKAIRSLAGKKFPKGLSTPRYNSPAAWDRLPKTTQF